MDSKRGKGKWISPILPYSDKRKQLLKITFLVNEQNVSVLYIDIMISQDECFCLKLRLEVEHAKSNLKTSLSQIWVVCHLLPFVRIGQYSFQEPGRCFTKYHLSPPKKKKNI